MWQTSCGCCCLPVHPTSNSHPSTNAPSTVGRATQMWGVHNKTHLPAWSPCPVCQCLKRVQASCVGGGYGEACGVVVAQRNQQHGQQTHKHAGLADGIRHGQHTGPHDGKVEGAKGRPEGTPAGAVGQRVVGVLVDAPCCLHNASTTKKHLCKKEA